MTTSRVFIAALRRVFAKSAAIFFLAAPGGPVVAGGPGFPKLNEGLASSVPYAFSSSNAFDGQNWLAIQKQTAGLATLTIGSFDGVPNASRSGAPIKIHYRIYLNRQETKGGVVISSGRTEGVALYQEAIYDLVKNGYSVYIHDHRGQASQAA